jgi:hypothetical protein
MASQTRRFLSYLCEHPGCVVEAIAVARPEVTVELDTADLPQAVDNRGQQLL